MGYEILKYVVMLDHLSLEQKRFESWIDPRQSSVHKILVHESMARYELLVL